MADLLPPREVHPIVHEVETDYEEGGVEDVEEDEGEPDEVEEDLVSESQPPTGQTNPSATDYALPEDNRDVWKNFGCETEAGRALRRLYGNTQQRDAASRVSYPRMISPARKWEPKAAARKPCPQRAAVAVPKPGRRALDRDDPRYWRIPAPGRKPASEIFAEMESNQPQRPDLLPGRNQSKMKQDLQDKFQFCGGSMMPKGAMGYVTPGEVPDAKLVRRDLPERWDHVDESGLTREQREIFIELTKAIQYKQGRLAEIDALDASEQKGSKAKTERNREALQLENDIERCMKDIDKLLQM
jgi:hypothetical protein